MTDERTPNQKLAEAISFGLQAKTKLDAMIEVLEDKEILNADDVLRIQSRAVELDSEYEKDVEPD